MIAGFLTNRLIPFTKCFKSRQRQAKPRNLPCAKSLSCMLKWLLTTNGLSGERICLECASSSCMRRPAEEEPCDGFRLFLFLHMIESYMGFQHGSWAARSSAADSKLYASKPTHPHMKASASICGKWRRVVASSQKRHSPAITCISKQTRKLLTRKAYIYIRISSIVQRQSRREVPSNTEY